MRELLEGAGEEEEMEVEVGVEEVVEEREEVESERGEEMQPSYKIINNLTFLVEEI